MHCPTSLARSSCSLRAALGAALLVLFPAALGAALLVLFPAAPIGAQEGPAKEIEGPVAAALVKVRDGDTLEVDAYIWPQHSVRVAVRLRGLDAPELRGECEAEKRAAVRAREHLAGLLDGREIRLHRVSGDKYYGRVLADVTLDDGTDVAGNLLKGGFVRPYGGKARASWCEGPLRLGDLLPEF